MADELAKVDEQGNELVSLDELQGKDLSAFSEKEYESLKTSDFLPRLQLMTSNSEKCKKGEFPVNNYALVEGSAFKDVGKTVDAIVFAWRPKALEIDDEIITIYKIEDSEFERIKDRADNEKDSGCMWGFEFLLWLGELQKFCTFFCGSKSARKEAPNVKSHMNGAITLRSKLIETKKYSWQGIDVVSCSTPMPMPTKVALEAELDKFNNPPKPDSEKVQDEGRAV